MASAQAGRASSSVRDLLSHPRGGPTVLRIVLGTHLRRLREGCGITREAAGDAIRGSHAKISRLELGRVGCKERDIADLLTLYGVVDEAQREQFLALARQASTARLVAAVQRCAAELVRDADRPGGGRLGDPHLRGAVHPGPAADRDYARAVSSGSATPGARRPAGRAPGRAADGAPAAPDPAARAQVVGGGGRGRAAPPARRRRGDARADQSSCSSWPSSRTSRCRSPRSSVGGLAAAGGPFTILRFPEPDLPDIVYLEQLTSALYLDKRDDVEDYIAVMDRLCATAEPHGKTAEFLDGLRFLEGLKRTL